MACNSTTVSTCSSFFNAKIFAQAKFSLAHHFSGKVHFSNNSTAVFLNRLSIHKASMIHATIRTYVQQCTSFILHWHTGSSNCIYFLIVCCSSKLTTDQPSQPTSTVSSPSLFFFPFNYLLACTEHHAIYAPNHYQVAPLCNSSNSIIHLYQRRSSTLVISYISYSTNVSFLIQIYLPTSYKSLYQFTIFTRSSILFFK